MIPRWSVVVAEVPNGLEDELAHVLAMGSLGAEIAPAGPERSSIRIYFASPGGAPASTDAAAAALRAHGLDPEGCALRVEGIEDGRWVERYQETLGPRPLGRRFVALPGPHVAAPGDRVAIRIVPGMAFGTGEHPTTRRCAAALERLVEPGSRWLDLGTGSGVLAVIAGACGARRVLGVDTDPAAVEVAREVVDVNPVAGAVEIRTGSIEARGDEVFDGVVANIASSFFLGRAEAIAASVVPGGTVVASGFLVEDETEIEAAFAAVDLTIEERTAEGPWSCVVARRRSLS